MKEFTKADLKDGMVLYSDDGTKGTLVSDYYTTREDLEIVNGKLIRKKSKREVTKIEYGEKVIWEKTTTKMTTEEMRQKLEELTGEKIEVVSDDVPLKYARLSRYCNDQSDCIECTFDEKCPLDFPNDEEFIEECYEKVMEDGKE